MLVYRVGYSLGNHLSTGSIKTARVMGGGY